MRGHVDRDHVRTGGKRKDRRPCDSGIVDDGHDLLYSTVARAEAGGVVGSMLMVMVEVRIVGVGMEQRRV